MKPFFYVLASLLIYSVSYADFEFEQFKAQVTVSRVTEDTSQLQTTDTPPVPLGEAAVTRSEPQKFAPAAATCVKVYPIDGREFGDNLITRVKVANDTALPKLIETTPDYVVYAFTAPGTHNVSFRQIGQNPLDFEELDVSVVVGGSVAPPSPVDPPKPPPIGGTVQEASRKAALSLNDPATSTSMINALRDAVTKATGQPLASQKQIVRDAIELVLLNRKGESRQKDWLTLWREPVNAAIALQNPQANYLALIREAIDGLASTAVAGQLPIIEMLTIEGCGDCEIFKQRDLPQIDFATIEIKQGRDASVRMYPAFRIHNNGRTVLVEGYRSADTLRTVVTSMTRGN